jgi:uncharacterized protein (TIGR00730 family)
MNKIESLLVYCGANSGNNLVYSETAKTVGTKLAKENIRLIYGGGSIGLMGIVADTVLQNKGNVTGVIPDFLNVKEVGHTGLTQMHIVKSMHERKALMEELSDAVIALPGGYGTLDELFEMLTWAQLGLHQKPIGLLNVNRFYDPLIAQLDTMVREGFLKENNRRLIHSSDSIDELMELLRTSTIRTEEKWIKRGEG